MLIILIKAQTVSILSNFFWQINTYYNYLKGPNNIFSQIDYISIHKTYNFLSVGPVMLLEYCEGGPMKDWLVDNKTRVNDDVIERLFRFAYDIARGMQFLASKEVNDMHNA